MAHPSALRRGGRDHAAGPGGPGRTRRKPVVELTARQRVRAAGRRRAGRTAADRAARRRVPRAAASGRCSAPTSPRSSGSTTSEERAARQPPLRALARAPVRRLPLVRTPTRGSRSTRACGSTWPRRSPRRGCCGQRAVRDRLGSLDLAALKGEILPDWYDDWLLLERERIRQLRLHALEAIRCTRLTAAGRFGEAIEAALLRWPASRSARAPTGHSAASTSRRATRPRRCATPRSIAACSGASCS